MPELKKCPLCGDTVEFEIDFPTFDGTGKTVKRIVPKRCACSLKKEEELKQQMELYNRKREVERLRSLSLIDAKAQNVTFESCEQTDGNARALKIATRYVAKFDDLNYDGEEIYVVGINCDDTALLRKGVDAGYVVPRITEESYIPTVIDICEKEKVDVILPFITAELPIMAENRELLESHGVKVSISSMESILASGNKVELAKHYPDLMPKQMICKKPLDFFQFADEIGYPKKPIRPATIWLAICPSACNGGGL